MARIVHFDGRMPLESITGLQVFSTCPSSSSAAQNYLQRVVETARWSEAAGCHGLLIYTDNSLVDPWMVAQVVIQNSRFQAPLVAVQPVYMHPYTVAKKVASLALLHGRRSTQRRACGAHRSERAAGRIAARLHFTNRLDGARLRCR